MNNDIPADDSNYDNQLYEQWIDEKVRKNYGDFQWGQWTKEEKIAAIKEQMELTKQELMRPEWKDKNPTMSGEILDDDIKRLEDNDNGC